MKNTFSKTVAWLKNLAVSVWEADDTHIEAPSKSDWAALVAFKEIHKHSLKEHFLAFAAVHIVSLSLVVRFITVALYALSAWLVIFCCTGWKLATLWKDAK